MTVTIGGLIADIQSASDMAIQDHISGYLNSTQDSYSEEEVQSLFSQYREWEEVANDMLWMTEASDISPDDWDNARKAELWLEAPIRSQLEALTNKGSYSLRFNF